MVWSYVRRRWIVLMSPNGGKRKVMKKTVTEVIDFLSNRKGFGEWYFNLDEDIQEEIEEELYFIIDRGNTEKDE